MTEELTPYVPANPGDAITSEGWNDMQIQIKRDIAGQVGEVQEKLDEFIESPIDAATFGGKDPEAWKKELDGRYAPLDHTHDGVQRYQRYFLELETVVGPALQPAVIIHNMWRYPLVQVYQLLDLPAAVNLGTNAPYKFCFYGPPHNDPDAVHLKTKSWDERHWGDPITLELIESLGLNPADFRENFTLNVWLSNLERALFEPGPGQYHFDTGDVGRTEWIRAKQGERVSTLIEQGEWPPRFVYRPRMLDVDKIAANDQWPEAEQESIGIYHLNMNEIEIAPLTTVTMALMLLLRS